MGHQFEDRHEAEVDATPDEVWAAIASGPGIDSWFMGRNEVQPGADGTVRTVFGDYAPEHTITTWEPGTRLAYGSGPDDDGRSIAYEFLVEGRDQGTTTVRMVVSGFLPGDDWDHEYEAMTAGTELFWRTLVTYLDGFAGGYAAPITAFGPVVADWDAAWASIHRELGLSAPVEVGDRVRSTPDDLPPIVGTVYAVNAQTLGVRTEDAVYRFLRGYQGPMIACHHLFADVDRPAVEDAWRAWLHRVLSTRPSRSAPPWRP
jgi:uncharacterized protein YndB with AHSA1/START domain